MLREIAIALLLVLPLAVISQETYSWTGWISEEYPEGESCQAHLGVGAARCRLAECDDIALGCLPLPEGTSMNYTNLILEPYWTDYVTGDATSRVQCDFNSNGLYLGLVFGLKTKNYHSAYVSAHCVSLAGGKLQNCHWTEFFSEDDGELDFPTGYYAVGFECHSANCGEMSYYICEVVAS